MNKKFNVWKLRLKGTELYYQPVKGRFEKTHLGPNGKMYLARKPKIKDICDNVSITQSLADRHGLMTEKCRWSCALFLKKGTYEWEIVEYECTESRTLKP